VTFSPGLVGWLAVGWSFLAGSAVGSFLNVVVARVPAGESIVRPGSRCPACRTPIRWSDNVPVLSWLLLRGRCRTCKIRISWRYPFVELLGGVTAVACTARHGLGPEAAAEFALVATLLALSAIDVDTWTLPHVITLPLLAAGIALSALHVTHAAALGASLAGAAAGWLGFAAVAFLGERLMKKEALGFGDVWLLSAIGAWMGLPALLPVVLLASLQGTVVGIALILLGRAQTGRTPEGAGPPPDPDDAWVPPRNAVPFGPFLAVGAVEWLWFQGHIVAVAPILGIFS
jgi:leader peptidase (prepilin peptidase)/N-methyltransferase